MAPEPEQPASGKEFRAALIAFGAAGFFAACSSLLPPLSFWNIPAFAAATLIFLVHPPSYLIGVVLTLPFAYFYGALPYLTAHQGIDLQLLAVFFAATVYSAARTYAEQAATARHALSSAALFGKTRLPMHAALTVLLLFSAWLRLSNLEFNVPYMDELLNFELRYMGNGHFIAGDSRFWGVLAHYSHAAWGLAGARGVAAVLGLGIVLLVYLVCIRLCAALPENHQLRFAPLLAAGLFSLSTPALFTSNLATHDNIALLLFMAGLLFFVPGVERRSPFHLSASAACFCLAFVGRFFILSLMPVIACYPLYAWGFAVLRKSAEQRLLAWFVLPLGSGFLLYVAMNFDHVTGSISLGSHLSASVTERSLFFTFYNVLLQLLPAAILLLLYGALRVFCQETVPEGQHRLRKYLGCSALLLPAIHLLRASDFTSEKNLSYSWVFAAMLCGVCYSNVFVQLRAPLRRAAAAIGVLLPFLLLLWFGLVTLIPLTSRKDFFHLVQPTLNDFYRRPLDSLLLGLLRLEQQRWLDPDAVRQALVDEGLDRQRMAVFGLYGGQHVNLHLGHTLGRDGTGEYFADIGSGWQKDTFAYADEKEYPVIVAVIPETEAIRFERNPDYPNYFFAGETAIPGIPGVYGRVFFIIDPGRLNLGAIPQAHLPYYKALFELEHELPEAALRLDRTRAEEILSSATETANTLDDRTRAIGIYLSIAKAYTTLGDSWNADQFYRRSALAAQKTSEPARFQTMINRVRASQYLYRIPADRPDLELRNGIDLLPLTAVGESQLEDMKQTNGKSKWLDFAPPIDIPKGAILAIDSTLEGSQIRAYRFVEKEQDYSKPGWMEVLPFSAGRQTVYIQFKEPFKLKQLDEQFGPKAWVPLGGSFNADSEIHALTLFESPGLLYPALPLSTTPAPKPTNSQATP